MKILEGSYGQMEFLKNVILDSSPEGALAIFAEEKIDGFMPIVVGLEYMVIPRSRISDFLRSNCDDLKDKYTEIIIYANYPVGAFRELAFTYREIERNSGVPIVITLQNNNIDELIYYDYCEMYEEEKKILKMKLTPTQIFENEGELKKLRDEMEDWARNSNLFNRDPSCKNELLHIISVLKVLERETGKKIPLEYIQGIISTFNVRRNCILRGNAYYDVLNFMGYPKPSIMMEKIAGIL